MSVDTLAPVLDVRAVRARYGLRDDRAARAVIDAAGGFRLAGRLFVRADVLEAYECAQADARRRQIALEPLVPRRPVRHAGPAPLGADWWRR
jgi:hypothetical protein